MIKKPFVLWFTGLSGAGKSTLADIIFDKLSTKTERIEKLDGDVMRNAFPKTGFSKQNRDDHIKRVGFMASLLEKHGVSVICSFISPYKDTRNFVRSMCKNFIEVYVCATIEECEKRDVKGLYKKVRDGQIKNFTGIDDPYQPPENPELIINTDSEEVQQSVNKIINYIDKFFQGDK
jgi:adenylylsulfate kinase